MPKQRFGLGRGLDALIPGAAPIADDSALDTSLSASALYEIPVDVITPNPQQPRAALDADPGLLDLAASIQEYGLLQPLLVTLIDDNPDNPRYQLIAGERRWRAAQIAGVDMVPVVIRQATPELALEMALVENLQRRDLNPLEEANAYVTLAEEYGLTHEQIGERIGRKRETITNKLRLLQLPREAQDALIQLPKVFTEGHARAVLQITDEGERVNATKLIIARLMSVRDAEELARRVNAAALSLTQDRRGGAKRPQSYETQYLEQEFIRAVEMKARLQRSTKGKGTLTLYFTNEDQLQTLYSRLVGQHYPGASALDLNGANGANGANGSDHDALDFGSLDSFSSLDDELPIDGSGDPNSEN
ncbi:MAG TPA: ParB/RepB/Spo0J family partition protein [Ktedonobacterales bacterium]|nr:ParB/RepB/Spo0J family partition protein [Ktedonobacterales bacterium]